MKFVPYTLAKTSLKGAPGKCGDPIVSTEYDTGNRLINITDITLCSKMRYPSTGRMVSEACTLVIFVTSGEATIVVEDKTIKIQAQDVIEINPEERFFWEVSESLSMLISSCPAWTDQHRFVK